MKAIKPIAFIFAALLISSVVYGQTIQETHKKLTEYHTNLTKKHNELNTGKVKDVKKHAAEVGALLEGAKKQEAELERKQTPKQKEVTKQQQESIKKYQANAENHFKIMKEEADKPNPSMNKIKEESKLMNSQILSAEKQNLEMEKLTKK